MKAAILGYGKSGKSAERILKVMGVNNITLYDDRIEGCMKISDFEDHYDMVVASPGIKLSNELVNSKNLTSEVELAVSLIKDKKIIVVTGTNGKSTVTYLTAQIINNFGIHASFCGNIGVTVADAVLDEQPEIYVVELSSFQIELLKRFKAHSVCITNIAPDHLDRYSCYEEYVTAKYRITEFIRNDGIVLYDKGNLYTYLLANSKILPVEIDNNLEGYPTLKRNILDFNKFYVDLTNYNLFGYHNIVNLAYALELADSVCDFIGDVTSVINDLKGLMHRCEFVREIDGVRYINDSKGTNVDSTLAGLKSSNHPTVLILGGKDKNGDFTQLVDEINNKVTNIILYGQATDVIFDTISNDINCKIVKVGTVDQAVKEARNVSSPGTTVLFSPACASFDQYSSFETRGDDFKNVVNEMKEGENDQY